MRWLLVVALVSGCVESNVVVCSNGVVCPEQTTCNVTLGICVTQQQTAECMGVDDGLACDVTAADEVCFQGVCLPSLCGDGIVGPGEICDDSNAVGGDGCSARCDSTESCGNGATDLALGEDCDDANLLDHDGCSSRCLLESPRWSRRPTAPSARMAPAMAYDSDRNRIILVGGKGNRLATGGSGGVFTLELDDWWEWDGRWLEPRTSAPPPKGWSALAYDADRKRTVFYGNSSTPETWEYDGVAWKLVYPGGPRRTDAAIAYDPIRKRVFMQGGYDPNNSSGNPESDLQIWDGTVWNAQGLPGGGTLGAPRGAGSMAFDYKRGTLLLFGGATTGGTLMNDLYEYNGTTWTQRTMNGASGADIPTPRKAAMMAWNGTCGCVVLFGGVTGGSTVNDDTFIWNGTAWTKITTTAGTPTARSYAAFTHDGHGRSVLVGGSRYEPTSSATDAYIEETWIFDGTVWKEDRARYHGTVAFDTDRRRVVMYGPGTVDGGESSRDTFELSERGWELLTSTTGPDTVQDAAMAYDEARKETVLVGGLQALNDVLEPDTWIWNGTAWATRTVATQMTPRKNGVLVYDVARQELVAFGGTTLAGAHTNETWTWNGTTWAQKTPTLSPSVRELSAAGYDRVNNKLILFGGTAPLGIARDTWSWDGVTWTKLDGGSEPRPSAVRPMMAWDPARRRLVLVSGDYFDAWEWDGTWWRWLGSLGARENPSQAMIHTAFDGAGITVVGGYYYTTFESSGNWELRWDSPHASDLCRIGTEADGDGLAACADRDCWGVCTPTCMPGETCSASAPRCGDSICGDAESCRSCPADCPTCNNICGDSHCDAGEACPGDCP